uniref:Citral reductase 1a n=1 Tax=Pelargonium hybrid cultivar TaxID=2986566 RepID=A0AA49K7K3_9ROSI|nr:citral reductase 1a [Pelargonium hybrid cultivar]
MESEPVALIVGVTGMTGLSLAEALKSPTALGGPWKVFGAARRPMPTWFPSTNVDKYITFNSTNVDDTRRQLSLLRHQISHVFWVALSANTNEEDNISTNSTMLANVLNTLLEPPSRLRHVTLQTGTKHYLGPLFDPTHHGVTHDPPFHEDLPRLPYRNFYYVLEDMTASYVPSITYSIHRPCYIIGASSRSTYNLLLAIALYAAICRHEGVPFKYPGNRFTWEHLYDFTDASLLAKHHIWAAVTDKSHNEAFNCTNGDVFMWKSLWKVLSNIFNVEFVEFNESDRFDIVELMKEKGQVWDAIVEKHGLYKAKLEEICCFDILKFAVNVEVQFVSSMNKSRDFGFVGHVDTFKSIQLWVNRLRRMKVIP